MSFDALDISASALYAQRTRMDTIASNLANINTTRNADGTVGAYKRKEVLFSAVYDKTMNEPSSENDFDFSPPKFDIPNVDVGSSMLLRGNVSFDTPEVANGVAVSQVTEDAKEPFKKVYEPNHPDADKDGFVNMPNINMVTEMVDMMSASRAYEANVTAIDTTKTMISSAMKI